MIIPDYGDYYDKHKKGGVAWDFEENYYPTFKIGKYNYIAKNMKNAELLSELRKHIDLVCNRILSDSSWKNSKYAEGVYIFLNLHKEQYYDDPNSLPEPFHSISKKTKTSRYLLSEIKPGTAFLGINKPRMRYEEVNAPYVGKDKNGRALYRHIFLSLDISSNEIQNLLIHELAHSMANHIFWRPDDHKEDFKWAEKLIKKNW